MVRSAEELFAIERMAAQDMEEGGGRGQATRERAGPTALNDDALVAATALARRDGVAQRWAMVLCLVSMCF